MILKRLRDEFFPPKDDFDSSLGVTTAGIVSLRRLRIASPHKATGIRYQPVDPATFRNAIQYVPRSVPFVDLGCGKGRALILAWQAGYRELTGVEFSPKLARACQRNLQTLGIPADIRVQDAATFYDTREIVAFLYNPFGVAVIRKILPRLRGHIVYVNPVHREAFAEFSVVHQDACFSVFARR
jgi:SAM-dependent methyltransferase